MPKNSPKYGHSLTMDTRSRIFRLPVSRYLWFPAISYDFVRFETFILQ